MRILFMLLGALAVTLPLCAKPRQNVLFICIDDLRPVLGCYDGQAKTPNIDNFAETAVQFNRHYVQFPSCGPSRSSMFGGVRPDSLGMYGNDSAGKVATRPDTHPTMPLHFRNHGYTTLSFGKTYHNKGAGPGFGWSDDPWQPPTGWTCYVNFQYNPQDKGKWRPAYEIYDGPDDLHGDYQTANEAIRAMEAHKDEPFFMAVGFYKPHLPFVAPKRFWDLYEDEEILPVQPTEIPEGGARYSYAWSEIWAYGDQQGKLFSADRPPSREQSIDMIRAYYAAVSFTDDHVGRMLDKLDELKLADNTIVVIWSDHGFHLGDQQRWAKWTQFEADMRSPLLIRVPGLRNTGFQTDAIAESIDLYPTLVQACNLTVPLHLAGTSQWQVITGQRKSVKDMAYSLVVPLGGNMEKLTALSMRSPDFRYIQWRSQKDNSIRAEELYDLRATDAELRNSAGDTGSELILGSFRARAMEGYPSLQDSK